MRTKAGPGRGGETGIKERKLYEFLLYWGRQVVKERKETQDDVALGVDLGSLSGFRFETPTMQGRSGKETRGNIIKKSFSTDMKTVQGDKIKGQLEQVSSEIGMVSGFAKNTSFDSYGGNDLGYQTKIKSKIQKRGSQKLSTTAGGKK